MKLITKIREMQLSIKELKKLNEDLIEKNLADRTKINSLENKILYLKNEISNNIDDLEKYIEENNANF